MNKQMGEHGVQKGAKGGRMTRRFLGVSEVSENMQLEGTILHSWGEVP